MKMVINHDKSDDKNHHRRNGKIVPKLTHKKKTSEEIFRGKIQYPSSNPDFTVGTGITPVRAYARGLYHQLTNFTSP